MSKDYHNLYIGMTLARAERWTEWHCDAIDDYIERLELLRSNRIVRVRGETMPGREWPQFDKAFTTGMISRSPETEGTVLLETDCPKCGRCTKARIRVDLMVRYGNGTPLEDLFDEPEQLAYLNDGLCRKCFNLANQGR